MQNAVKTVWRWATRVTFIPAAVVASLLPCSLAWGAKLVDAVLYSTRGDNQVHVLAASDLSLLGSIDAGVGAHELAISGDGRWVMGSAYGGPGQGHQPADKRLVVIDMQKGEVHKTIDLGSIARPNDIAFMPNSSEAVVTAEAPQHVLVVNAETGAVRPISLERKTGHMLALSRDAKTVFVSHVMPGGVTFVDIATGKSEAVVDVPTGAEGIAVSPDGKTLWVASNRAGKVSIIDVQGRKVSSSFDCEGFPFRVRFAPDGKTVAISCPNSAEVALFEASAPDKVRRVGVMEERAIQPTVPTSVSFVPGGRTLASLCDGAEPQVVLIDVGAGKVAARRPADGPIADALVAGRVMWKTPS